MKKYLLLFLNLNVLVLLTLVPFGSALAHGAPVIDVQPAVAPAGGEIAVTGTEMEPGEVFKITLEGPAISTPLGQAAAAGEGEEGGFVARFMIPVDVSPGSYTVRAETEAGEAALSDLTITGASTEASTGPATVQEPTGEKHGLDRSKPAGQVFGAIAVALVSLGLGLWLVLRRG
ncbi:MAG TPA: hypothetical protein VF498_07305 [Anaerolineales bacterium]